MAILQKPQVSGTKKWAFLHPGYPPVERLLCLFRFSPVPLRNTRAADPYLADIAGPAWSQRIRRNDAHGLLHRRTATGHQQLALFLRYLCSIPRSAIVRVTVGSMVHGSDAVRIKTSADKQSSFRQAITWNKGLAAKTTVGELCGKPVQRFQSYWFGAVERHPPRTQVESAPVFRADFPHAEFVGKVRSAAGRRPIAGNGLQPAQRSLQEGHRRHQDRGHSCVQRLQYITDQPHVVKQRQPAYNDTARLGIKRILDHPLVIENVRVTYHHSFGRGRRARRVLQKCDICASYSRRSPQLIAIDREGVGVNPLDMLPRRCRDHVANRGRSSSGGQYYGGLGGGHHRLDAGISFLIQTRRINGDRDYSRAQTTEKRYNVVGFGGIEKQSSLAYR